MKKIFTLLLTAVVLFTGITSLSSFTNPGPTLRTYNEISIVSDRASGEAMVRYKAIQADKAQLRVEDEAGNSILQQEVQLTPGENNIRINKLMTLEEGTYRVTLQVKKATHHSSLIIWK